MKLVPSDVSNERLNPLLVGSVNGLLVTLEGRRGLEVGFGEMLKA